MPTIFEDNGLKIPNNRKPDYNIDQIFINRWSPRGFDPEPIPENTLMSIFEAARWSMSCFNEQPWRFFIATDPDDLKLYRSILSEKNQSWTVNAPLVGYIVAANRFAHNDKPNHWAQFDCGAAWMALTMQARMMGLYTHGMAGFDREKAYEILNVDKNDYTVVAAFTIGKYGDPDRLREDLKQVEFPNERRPVKDSIFRGRMK